MLNLTLYEGNCIVFETSDGVCRIVLNDGGGRPWNKGNGVRLAIDAPGRVAISREKWTKPRKGQQDAKRQGHGGPSKDADQYAKALIAGADSLKEYLRAWERAYSDGQTTISQAEAIKRWEREVGG